MPGVVIASMAVVLVAVGVVAGGLLFWDPAPASINPSSGGDSFQVTNQSFDDSRMVSVTVTLGAAQTLASPVTGRVTSSTCDAGAEVVSGSSTFAIDGVPVVNLATSVPLWRDMARGDTGADVSAFTAELARLGVLSGNGSTGLSQEVITAWRDMAIALGAPSSAVPRDGIPQSLIAWLPSSGAVVSQCDVLVGGLVSPGQPLATFSAPVTAAYVPTRPSQLTPGDRILAIDDQTTLTVNADGMIDDPASLSALASSPTVRTSQALGVLDSLTGRYSLATPIQVSVVPPLAIVSSGGTTGCVIADGESRQVTVVASQLGQSLVLFEDGGPPPQAVSLDPPTALTCG